MDCKGIVTLKPKEERRLFKGHLWVFSNEIRELEGDMTNGELVEVRDSTKKKIIGYGLYNHNSLICVRLLSRIPISSIDEFLRSRINDANSRRAQIGLSHSYRMVFGESDLLPGLIIDRFGGDLVIESFTAGMDKLFDRIATIIVQDYAPRAIYEKSTSLWRGLENVEIRERLVFGTQEETIVQSSAMSYNINIMEGQKTGFYLDQSANRLIVEKCSQGKRVLDCFCNDGGFALHAAKGGADSVLGIDSSEAAIKRAKNNAMLNNINNIAFQEGDVFSFLHETNQSGKQYDLIILDPPAFVKSKKMLATGLAGYEKLNRLAFRILAKNGILVSCSCSQHVSETDFLETLQRAAAKEGRALQLLSVSGAAQDHPVLVTMPETKYLKCAFVAAL